MKSVLVLLMVGLFVGGCSSEGPLDKHEREERARVNKRVTEVASIVAKERFGHSVVKCHTDKVIYTLWSSTYTHKFYPCLV